MHLTFHREPDPLAQTTELHCSLCERGCFSAAEYIPAQLAVSWIALASARGAESHLSSCWWRRYCALSALLQKLRHEGVLSKVLNGGRLVPHAQSVCMIPGTAHTRLEAR